MARVFKRILLLTVATVALALPTQALAQAPTDDAYDAADVSVVGEDGAVGSGGQGTPDQSAVSGGGLPFTGLDLLMIGLAGGGLVAVGLVMRRLTRHPGTA